MTARNKGLKPKLLKKLEYLLGVERNEQTLEDLINTKLEINLEIN